MIFLSSLSLCRRLSQFGWQQTCMLQRGEQMPGKKRAKGKRGDSFNRGACAAMLSLSDHTGQMDRKDGIGYKQQRF